ncbi:MAG: 2-hydroxyacid dehydrogenase [Ilumatobacter sp.]|nr:2-hydroxyacid dehydrogenase [Ilumatobacter sp.]
MSAIHCFSAKAYDRACFDEANRGPGHDITYLDARLDERTVGLAAGIPVVCAFVNDDLTAPILRALAAGGTTCVAMRCAGYNNVDLDAARAVGITVVRVPAYSPNAVAEHTLALILGLNRNVHRAYNRVRDRNFSLEGLVGFDLAGRTAGIVGTGQIGAIVARLLWHFRCTVVASDPQPDSGLVDLGVEYVELDELLGRSDIVSLNCPLTEATHHLIDAAAIGRMRRGVMLVNTGRGPLIDTPAAIDGLKSGQLGSLALDVYEEEAPLFFEDRSQEILDDDVFARLLTFPNVLITAHQAFLTRDALAAIATTTLANVADVVAGRPCANSLT